MHFQEEANEVAMDMTIEKDTEANEKDADHHSGCFVDKIKDTTRDYNF